MVESKRTHKRYRSLSRRGLAKSINNTKSYNVNKLHESYLKNAIALYKKNVADYNQFKSNSNYYKLSKQERELNYWYYKITYEICLQIYLLYSNLILLKTMT